MEGVPHDHQLCATRWLALPVFRRRQKLHARCPGIWGNDEKWEVCEVSVDASTGLVGLYARGNFMRTKGDPTNSVTKTGRLGRLSGYLPSSTMTTQLVSQKLVSHSRIKDIKGIRVVIVLTNTSWANIPQGPSENKLLGTPKATAKLKLGPFLALQPWVSSGKTSMGST